MVGRARRAAGAVVGRARRRPLALAAAGRQAALSRAAAREEWCWPAARLEVQRRRRRRQQQLEVFVALPPVAQYGAPSAALPMLQTHVDTLVLGALRHGRDFAAELLESTGGWSHYWLNDRLEVSEWHERVSRRVVRWFSYTL